MRNHVTQRRAARLLWGAVFALALVAGSATTAAAQISIVVSASSSHSASPAELAQMFGGAVTSWGNGSQVQIVDQADSPVGATFYADFVGRSVSQVRKAFTALLLSGQAPQPQQVANDAAVKSAVAGNPNAVGYIASSALDDTVKEVARIGG